MTPEQIAKNIVSDYQRSLSDIGLRQAIANSIRQAVAEEREACALLAHGEIGFASDNHWAQGWNEAAKRIYELIRERK